MFKGACKVAASSGASKRVIESFGANVVVPSCQWIAVGKRGMHDVAGSRRSRANEGNHAKSAVHELKRKCKVQFLG